MKLQNLSDAFEMKLSVLYDMENQIVKALPKVVKAVHDSKLKEAFETHLAETKGHVERLDEIFKSLEISKAKIKGEGIRGMIADMDALMKQDASDDVMDSCLAAMAQYIEHYEIAAYTAAASWAGIMGLAEAEDLLEETLAEEENADSLISEISETINERANMDAIDPALAPDMPAETGDETDDPSESA